jgi:RNA polymerase sigma-70 factor (ECF subfamily)
MAGDRESRLVRLVARVAQHDQEALASLYDETAATINGLLIRMLHDPGDAEEALLDVYMKAWRHAGSYKAERSPVQSWLVMMARGIAIDRLRSRRAQIAASEEPEKGEAVSAAATPEQQTLDSERRTQVKRVLDDLTVEQREVLLLAFFSGYTHSELARRLGQPLGTIKSRIRTALLKLRNLMNGEAT